MTPEQQQEIAKLRSQNLTPKQIARKLGLRVAEVTAVIKQEAQQLAITRAATGELDPVAECFVNADCAHKFLKSDGAAKFLGQLLKPDENSAGELDNGLAMVSVARLISYNRFSVCTYLLDMWCLGVKDTLGPRKVDKLEYEQLIESAYRGFPEGTQKITLEQAQAIVFSAVDYAAKLGFNPHRDFENSRAHLGEWNGETKIKCGRNGKPFYISGPYDNPRRILDTLNKSVGEGNFEYLAPGF